MSTPNVQAVRRVLTVLLRAAELLGFPPIPCHSMRLHPPRMHNPRLMGKKIIHCRKEDAALLHARNAEGDEEGRSVQSPGFRREIRASSRLQISARALSTSPTPRVYPACAMTGGKQIEFPVPVTYRRAGGIKTAR